MEFPCQQQPAKIEGHLRWMGNLKHIHRHNSESSRNGMAVVALFDDLVLLGNSNWTFIVLNLPIQRGI